MNATSEFDFLPPQPQGDSDLLNLWGFIPGIKEFLMLRQVHALEHATVWMLSEMSKKATKDNLLRDDETLGGLSTEEGFYLYGTFSVASIELAVRRALYRLKAGEWRLAIHPRCGTNLSVNLVLTAGFALGAHLLLPRSPLEQLLGLGLAIGLATQLSFPLGLEAQKYLTTAIPFNLQLSEIVRTDDLWGQEAYFIRLNWQQVQ